ncbi:unnamed protein product, partial [Cyprideis torosa]
MAEEHGLGETLKLGPGELKSGGFRRHSIMEDAMEAIIGAVFLLRGFSYARDYILALFQDRLDNLPASDTLKDPKSRLQEWLQSRGETLPVYAVVEVQGEAHKQTFTSDCRVAYRDIVTHAVVIAGRPNVGKSTLLNAFVGVHLAAATNKPQTTRNRILGICSDETSQIVFLDTPGIHIGGKRLLNRTLNRTAIATLPEGDVVMFVVEAGRWTEEEEAVLHHVRSLSAPVVLVVNKVDKVDDKSELIPFLQLVQGKFEFAEIIPVSAHREKNVRYLLKQLRNYLPEAPFAFPADEITNRNMRFIAAEMVREQLTDELAQELPYSLAVDIEQFDETPEAVVIGAVIYVEKAGQKGIVIGNQGKRLKSVGTKARHRIEAIMGQHVRLRLWVKDSAIVLHSRRYRESSRIIELFTRQYGRIAAVARVSSRKGAGQSVQFQPFTELFVSWSGRGELKSLRQSDLVKQWSLKGRASICGLYVNELLLGLLQKELAMPELYLYYQQALGNLEGDDDVATALRYFELQLLDEMGYLPSLDTDSSTGECLVEGAVVFFSPSQGVTRVRTSIPDAFP